MLFLPRPPWTSKYPDAKKPAACLRYWRHLLRYRAFGIHPDPRLVALRGRYAGKRCFIIGNGPSLLKRDISALGKEYTFGANAIFRKFDAIGFRTTFLCQVDITQAEDWGAELAELKGITRFVALKNSFAYPIDKEIIVLNSGKLTDDEINNPPFSLDAGRMVYHSYTVTVIALQLAYYMGFSEAYLIGVDHDYGPLTKMFPPGKLMVTQDNLDLVNQAHFSPGYYKIGDRIGIPNTPAIEGGYIAARDAFAADGRKVMNASEGGKLEIFERVAFDSLF